MLSILNFSLNLGLHLSRADYIARIDSDDLSHPQRLEKQLKVIENNSKLAVVGSSYNLINNNDEVKKTIAQDLRRRRIQKEVKLYIEKLKKSATVRIFLQ